MVKVTGEQGLSWRWGHSYHAAQVPCQPPLGHREHQSMPVLWEALEGGSEWAPSPTHWAGGYTMGPRHMLQQLMDTPRRALILGGAAGLCAQSQQTFRAGLGKAGMTKGGCKCKLFGVCGGGQLGSHGGGGLGATARTGAQGSPGLGPLCRGLCPLELGVAIPA